MKDSTHLTGTVFITHKDENGEVKEKQNIHNIVVNTGKNYIAQKMSNRTIPFANVMSAMAVGTESDAAATGQVELEGEAGRVALTSNAISDNTVTYSATFGAGVGTATLKEAGIFSDTANGRGTMLCRTVFSDIVKASGDSVDVVWNVTVN